MTRFAKLEGGRLVPAPTKIEENGYLILNPSAAKLRELGYKEVVWPTDDAPKENAMLAYRDDGDFITAYWTEDAPAEEVSAEQRRKAAYEAEADGYLLAYYGYMAEGKTEQAEEQKALYIETKKRIRAKYPDNE